MNLRIMILFIIIISPAFLNAQENMLDALEQFKKAQGIQEVLAAAETFKKIADENNNDWVPSYWSSFIFSQAGRSSPNKDQYYDLAEDYLKETKSRANPTSSSEKVYILALEALISNLKLYHAISNGRADEVILLSERKEHAIQSGLAENPNSPLLLVLIGTSLISESFQKNPSIDLEKMIIGKIVLEKAKEQYMSLPETDPLTPDRWNEGWIEVWLTRIKR